MSMRRLALVLPLVALAAGCTSAAPSAPDRPTNPSLRVGLAPDSPPVVFRQGPQIVGLEPDMARALAEALGRPLEFVPYEWDNLIPALLAGRIDVIMSGMTVTPARQ